MGLPSFYSCHFVFWCPLSTPPNLISLLNCRSTRFRLLLLFRPSLPPPLPRLPVSRANSPSQEHRHDISKTPQATSSVFLLSSKLSPSPTLPPPRSLMPARLEHPQASPSLPVSSLDHPSAHAHVLLPEAPLFCLGCRGRRASAALRRRSDDPLATPLQPSASPL